MELKEFNIESRKELFRIGHVTPVELLSIATVLDLEKLTQVTEFVTFALEHAEVKMGETWQPVKVKGKEIYMPLGMENDFAALNEIVAVMLNEVVSKAFN